MLAALGEPPDPALDPELRAAVAERTLAWARAITPAVSSLGPTDDVAGALSTLLAGHHGPVLLVADDVPRLDRALADAALGDVTSGCALSFAPSTDGKPFLLAFSDPRPDALALLDAGNRHRDEIFAAALALGGEVGMLRSERRVVTPADAAALALDPLIPADLRALAARHL